jgi:hypothetical protein
LCHPTEAVVVQPKAVRGQDEKLVGSYSASVIELGSDNCCQLFNVQLKGGNAFVGDAKDFKEGNPEGVGFAEKQCPRFNFVPVKTHLTPMKVSLDVN